MAQEAAKAATAAEAEEETRLEHEREVEMATRLEADRLAKEAERAAASAEFASASAKKRLQAEAKAAADAAAVAAAAEAKELLRLEAEEKAAAAAHAEAEHLAKKASWAKHKAEALEEPGVKEAVNWVCSCGLSSYAASFWREGVDVEALLAMKQQMAEEGKGAIDDELQTVFGMLRYGDRIKFKKALAEFRGPATGPTQSDSEDEADLVQGAIELRETMAEELGGRALTGKLLEGMQL